MLLLLVKNDSLRVMEFLLFRAKRSNNISPCRRTRLFWVDSLAWLSTLLLCTHGVDAQNLSVWIRLLRCVDCRIWLIRLGLECCWILRPLHLVHFGFQNIEPLVVHISLHSDNSWIFGGSVECGHRTLLNIWGLRTTDDSLSLPPESKRILVNQIAVPLWLAERLLLNYLVGGFLGLRRLLRYAIVQADELILDLFFVLFHRFLHLLVVTTFETAAVGSSHVLIISLGSLRIFLLFAHEVLSNYLILKVFIDYGCVVVSLFDSLHLSKLVINHFLTHFDLPKNIKGVTSSRLKNILRINPPLLLKLIELLLRIAINWHSIWRFFLFRLFLFYFFLVGVRLDVGCRELGVFSDPVEGGLVLSTQPISVLRRVRLYGILLVFAHAFQIAQLSDALHLLKCLWPTRMFLLVCSLEEVTRSYLGIIVDELGSRAIPLSLRFGFRSHVAAVSFCSSIRPSLRIQTDLVISSRAHWFAWASGSSRRTRVLTIVIVKGA